MTIPCKHAQDLRCWPNFSMNPITNWIKKSIPALSFLSCHAWSVCNIFWSLRISLFRTFQRVSANGNLYLCALLWNFRHAIWIAKPPCMLNQPNPHEPTQSSILRHSMKSCIFIVYFFDHVQSIHVSFNLLITCQLLNCKFHKHLASTGKQKLNFGYNSKCVGIEPKPEVKIKPVTSSDNLVLKRNKTLS